MSVCGRNYIGYYMFDNVKLDYADELAGKTFEWIGEDNLENFNKHLNDPNTHDCIKPWIDKKITYQFNTHGFRSPEFISQGDYFLCFGCSFTFGTAIQAEQRYGDLVASRTNLTSYNFGVQGGNDSTSFRLALTWLDKLNPKFVVYQTTFSQRFEVINNNIASTYGINAALGGKTAQGFGELYKQIITTEANGQLLAIKNRLAIRQLCQEKNVRLIEIDCNEFHDSDARDLHHPGPIANQQVAEIILNTL